jgi:peroxiredoxin Q/BCP
MVRMSAVILAGLLAGNMVRAAAVGERRRTSRRSHGRPVKLADFKGKWSCCTSTRSPSRPCTKESCSLRDGHAALAGLKAVVLASSGRPGDPKKFKADHNLPFELIADSEKRRARAYDVLAPMGLFAIRRTFIISPDGKIAHVFESVSVGPTPTT